MYYLGVNFGRTVITVGVVDENGEIIIKGSVPTLKYRGIEDIVKDIATLCIRVVNNAKLNIDKDIVSIGIAITGIPDKKDGTIVYSSYFDYHTVQVKSILKQYINLPIYIENDANCYGLAESRWGAAKGFKNSVTVNIGQGVGAGIIVDGKIPFPHLDTSYGLFVDSSRKNDSNRYLDDYDLDEIKYYEGCGDGSGAGTLSGANIIRGYEE